MPEQGWLVDIEHEGRWRWRWTVWDQGNLAVQTGMGRTKRRAHASAMTWVRARHEGRA